MKKELINFLIDGDSPMILCIAKKKVASSRLAPAQKLLSNS